MSAQLLQLIEKIYHSAETANQASAGLACCRSLRRRSRAKPAGARVVKVYPKVVHILA